MRAHLISLFLIVAALFVLVDTTGAQPAQATKQAPTQVDKAPGPEKPPVPTVDGRTRQSPTDATEVPGVNPKPKVDGKQKGDRTDAKRKPNVPPSPVVAVVDGLARQDGTNVDRVPAPPRPKVDGRSKMDPTDANEVPGVNPKPKVDGKDIGDGIEPKQKPRDGGLRPPTVDTVSNERQEPTDPMEPPVPINSWIRMELTGGLLGMDATLDVYRNGRVVYHEVSVRGRFMYQTTLDPLELGILDCLEVAAHMHRLPPFYTLPAGVQCEDCVDIAVTVSDAHGTHTVRSMTGAVEGPEFRGIRIALELVIERAKGDLVIRRDTGT